MKKNSKVARVSTERLYRGWVAPIRDISDGGSWCGGGWFGVESGTKIRSEEYFESREAAEEWALKNLERWTVRGGRKMKSRKIVEAKAARKADRDIRGVKAGGAVAFVLDGDGWSIAVGGVETKSVLVRK